VPYKSKRQQRWAHSPSGKEALTDKEIKEFDESTDFESLPEEAQAGKGPTRRQGSGQKTPQIVKDLKRASREVHKDMPKGGPQSTKKGDKGYNRKQKHKNSDDETIGEELTQVDETYRGVGFPMAKTLSWKTSARRGSGLSSAGDDEKYGDDDETPVVDTPGFPPTKEGGGDVPDKGAAWGSSIAADLTWSTHKSETFNDEGEKGGVSAWGLKSVIDRGVKTHEKPSGAKRIEDAENQTTKREIPGKQFKSYSMIGAFNW
jgi:hypothetical protein